MAQRAGTAALVVDGLWEQLWRNKIHYFEHDPRLLEAPDEQRAATGRRWVTLATEQCRERGIGTRRERHAAREPFTFARYLLRDNLFGIDPNLSHPLVTDRSIRWLTVDHNDVVTMPTNEVG